MDPKSDRDIDMSQTPKTNAKLASMLADALSQVESLKAALQAEQRKAAHFESLSNSLSSNDTEKIAALEKRVYQAELDRDSEISRSRALVEQWSALSRYFDRVDAVVKDARLKMDRVISSSAEVGYDFTIPVFEDEQESYVYHPNKRNLDSAALPPAKRAKYTTYSYPPPQPQQPQSRQHHHHVVHHHHSHTRPRSRSRTRSTSPRPHHRSHSNSSANSIDVDEMLLQATTGDSPQQAHARRMGPPVVYPPHAYSHLPPPLTVPHAHPHGYAPVSAGSAGSSHSHRYTSNSESPPISRREPSYEYSRERERAHSQSQYHQPQLVVRESLPGPASTQPPQAGKTHTFVPIQTGAPVKKGRWSANMDTPQSSTSPTNGAGVPHSTTMPAIPSSHQHQPLQASASLPSASTQSQSQSQTQVSASQPSTSTATAPFPPTNPSGQRICRQCGALGRYKDGKCVEKWGPGPCGPGTVCDRCRKKMKRVERRRMAALGENGVQANQGSNGIQEGAGVGEGGLVEPGTATRMVVAPAASASMLQVPVATSALPSTASSSRAASIVNGTGGSRKGSPSIRPTQSVNGVGTPRKVGSTLGPNAPNGKHVKSKSNDSSSRGSGSGSMMDIDADGEADDDFVEPTQLDPEADITDLVERQVEEELIEVTRGSRSPDGGVDRDLEEMLGDGEGEKNARYMLNTRPNGHGHAPNGSTKSYSSPYAHAKPSVTKKEDIDMQVSHLSGMDRRGQEEDGDGDVSVEMEDGDAETDLLEAVHAAEAKA